MAADTAISGTGGGSAPPSYEGDAAERPSDDVADTRRAPGLNGGDGGLRSSVLRAYAALAMLDFGHLEFARSEPTWQVHESADQIVQVSGGSSGTYYALIHGHNLLFTEWLNYPVGFNAGVNGSMPALGMCWSRRSPSIFGPVVSWNVLERAAPFVSALSMCLVLRRWTTWWPAAFVGGLLYGFSCYVTSSGDHLFLAFVPLPPLFFLLLHEALVRQQWRPRRTGALIALVCAAQYFICTEVFATMVMMGAIAIGALGACHPKAHPERCALSEDDQLSTPCWSERSCLSIRFSSTSSAPSTSTGCRIRQLSLALQHGDLLGLVVPGYRLRLTVPGLVVSSYLINSSNAVPGDSSPRRHRRHRRRLASSAASSSSPGL